MMYDPADTLLIELSNNRLLEEQPCDDSVQRISMRLQRRSSPVGYH